MAAKQHEFLQVSIWRGTANSNDGYDDYQVPKRESQTILDVVSWIQRHVDPGLTYRFACRVGMCGSCAMMVNGLPMWTCRTHVNKAIKGNDLVLEPLRNFTVIKDLACDMSIFFDKWQKAKATFSPTLTRDHEIQPVLPDSKAADAAIECINCAVCYAACDVVANNSQYFGPAALNRAWSLINDERDGGDEDRLAAANGAGGCHNCHTQSNCARYCPNELNPTLSIAGLKRAGLRAAMKGNP